MEYKEKDLDLLCYDFDMQIRATINSSNLNISIIELSLKNILNEISVSKNEYLRNKLKERQSLFNQKENIETIELPVTIEKE